MSTTSTIQSTFKDRARLFDIGFVLACGLSWLLYTYLSRELWFTIDEWWWINQRDGWTFDALMQPYNGHWSLGLGVAYKTIFALAGMQSYGPYIAVGAFFHVVTATAVYVYIRGRQGALVALLGSLFILFPAAASANLFWGLQVAWLISAAAGAWALTLLLRDPGRRSMWAAAALLVVGVATSGAGLFFLAAAGGLALASPRRREFIWVVIPATVAFAIWYLTLGRGAQSELAGVSAVIDFVRSGATSAIHDLIGLGPQVGLIVAVVTGLVFVVHVSERGNLKLGFIAGVIGVIGEFVVIGMVRGDTNPDPPIAPRYLHTTTVLILFALFGWISARANRARMSVVLAGMVAIALVAGLPGLRAVYNDFQMRADRMQAAVLLLTEYGGSPAVPADQGARGADGHLLRLVDAEIAVVPPAGRLARILEEQGSPLSGGMAAAGHEVGDGTLDLAFVTLVGDAYGVREVDTFPSESRAPALTSDNDVVITERLGCLEVEATGEDARLHPLLPGGSELYLTVDGHGTATVYHSPRGAFTAGSAIEISTDPEVIHVIRIPDLSTSEPLPTRLDLPPGLTARLCLGGSDGGPSTSP